MRSQAQSALAWFNIKLLSGWFGLRWTVLARWEHQCERNVFPGVDGVVGGGLVEADILRTRQGDTGHAGDVSSGQGDRD